MTKTRKCAYCGKVFIQNSGMQKYCSEECATAAKEARKKKQRDYLRAVEPVMELQQQEYLTFSKAALLLGCTRQYVYKLVEQGKLPASRLSDSKLQTANNEKREIASLDKGVAGIRIDAEGVDIRERHAGHAILAAIDIACVTITGGDGNAEVTAQTVANIRSNIELHSGVVTAIGVIGGETYLTTNPYLSFHSSS